jgi:hypothetical protein
MPGKATHEELEDLLVAARRHCTCPPGPLTRRLDPCPPHRLVADEGALRRLLFYRRYASTLLLGEWTRASGWSTRRAA